jgi:hypothetical protein
MLELVAELGVDFIAAGSAAATLGAIATVKELAKEIACDKAIEKRRRELMHWYHGTSRTRARSIEVSGFAGAGVGMAPDNQFGPGLYMFKIFDWAEGYAKQYPHTPQFEGGSVLYITSTKMMWEITLGMGAKENAPVAVGPPGQVQDFVPYANGALDFFDAVATKFIITNY